MFLVFPSGGTKSQVCTKNSDVAMTEKIRLTGWKWFLSFFWGRLYWKVFSKLSFGNWKFQSPKLPIWKCHDLWVLTNYLLNKTAWICYCRKKGYKTYLWPRGLSTLTTLSGQSRLCNGQYKWYIPHNWKKWFGTIFPAKGSL